MYVMTVGLAYEYLRSVYRTELLPHEIPQKLVKFLTLAHGISTAKMDFEYKRELLSSLESPFREGVVYGFYDIDYMFFVSDGELHFSHCQDLPLIVLKLTGDRDEFQKKVNELIDDSATRALNGER